MLQYSIKIWYFPSEKLSVRSKSLKRFWNTNIFYMIHLWEKANLYINLFKFENVFLKHITVLLKIRFICFRKKLCYNYIYLQRSFWRFFFMQKRLLKLDVKSKLSKKGKIYWAYDFWNSGIKWNLLQITFWSQKLQTHSALGMLMYHFSL